MKGEKDLVRAVQAGYSLIYVSTQEVVKTTNEVFNLFQEYVSPKTGENPFSPCIWDFAINPDPEWVSSELEGDTVGRIVIAKNLNWFLKDLTTGEFNKELVSLLQSRVDSYSSPDNRKVLIVISDSTFSEAIPTALAKDFVEVEFALPGEEEIKNTYEYIKKSAEKNPNFKAPTEEVEGKVLACCKGLTVREIKNALAFSLVQNEGTFVPTTIASIRAQGIENTAGLKIGRKDVNYSHVVGYDEMKEFAYLTQTGLRQDLALGFMTLGPPGTGKTLFCSALGNEVGLEVFVLEIGLLFGSLVGESEKKTDQALNVVAANAPCILFMDEIEKAIGGGGDRDGGTSSRATAQILKFLSDNRPPGVRVFATCNNIRRMPPEWVRAERWDCAPFFVDLPNEQEQEAILAYYQDFYKVKGRPSNMKGWSGAEIKSACRIAVMMGKSIEQVERYIIPVSMTMADEIADLRKWADVDGPKRKVIPASTPIPKNGEKKRGMDF